MDRLLATNIGALVTHRDAAAITALTAGGTGDNTSVNGYGIDRGALGMPANANVVFYADASLTAAKVLNITALKIQDSADNSTWADYKALTAPGTIVSGTGTQHGQSATGVNLSSARQYVRVVYTPDLTASGTDTANVACGLLFAGFDELPAPA